MPPEVTATASTSHDAITAALREDEDLRTRVRESSGPAVRTPPPSRVGLPTDTDTASFTVVPRVVDRRGDDTAQHTNMIIVEETQGSPNDLAGPRGMVVESPDWERHPSVHMEDVHMERLNLGADDNNNVELIQQT